MTFEQKPEWWREKFAKIQEESPLERRGNGKALRQEGIWEPQKASVARAEWISMRVVEDEEGKKMRLVLVISATNTKEVISGIKFQETHWNKGWAMDFFFPSQAVFKYQGYRKTMLTMQEIRGYSTHNSFHWNILYMVIF